MQRLLLFGLCLALSSSGALAQRGGSRGGGGFGGFRGGGSAIGRIGSAIGGFGRGGSSFIGGFGRGGGYYRGGGYFRGGGYYPYYSRGFYGYYGWGYPWAYGYGYGLGLYGVWPGYYSYYGGYGGPSTYYNTAYEYEPAPSAPPVVINQNRYYPPETARPELRTYQAPAREYNTAPPPPAPPPSSAEAGEYRPALYLLALHDGSVLTSVAYWVQGEVLHYVTRDRVQHEVALNRVDRELTLRLNHERHVDVYLP